MKTNKDGIEIIRKLRSGLTIRTLVFIGLLGVALMVIASPAEKKINTTETNRDVEYAQAYIREIEKKLESVIQNIEGAGKIQVAVTLEAGEEFVYAVNQRENGENKGGETQHIIMNDSGRQQPLVEMVWEPTIRGIAVVCQGADRADVAAQIVETVSVLTGVRTNRISVAKMN